MSCYFGRRELGFGGRKHFPYKRKHSSQAKSSAYVEYNIEGEESTQFSWEERSDSEEEQNDRTSEFDKNGEMRMKEAFRNDQSH